MIAYLENMLAGTEETTMESMERCAADESRRTVQVWQSTKK